MLIESWYPSRDMTNLFWLRLWCYRPSVFGRQKSKCDHSSLIRMINILYLTCIFRDITHFKTFTNVNLLCTQCKYTEIDWCWLKVHDQWLKFHRNFSCFETTSQCLSIAVVVVNSLIQMWHDLMLHISKYLNHAQRFIF